MDSNFEFDRAVMRLKREVWGSKLGPAKSTQCCHRLATAATFLRKELSCSGSITRRWAPQIRYMLWRSTASIMKDVICLLYFLENWVKINNVKGNVGLSGWCYYTACNRIKSVLDLAVETHGRAYWPKWKKNVLKLVFKYPVINLLFVQKNHFLAYLNLITKEKAEKLRNRRSGRRRAVAHPVYSGGLYVSHSTTNTKRVIPPELLDIGLETIPTKRPRGKLYFNYMLQL